MVTTFFDKSGQQLVFGLKGAGTILLLVFLALVVVDIALSLLSTYWRAVGVIGPFTDNELHTAKNALSSVMSPCAVFLTTWLVLRFIFRGVNSRSLLEEFGVTPVASHAWLFCAFAGGVCYQSVLEYVLVPMFPPGEGLTAHPAGMMFELPIEFVISAFVGGVLLAPIAEEFLFRGVIYKGLEQQWNKPVSMIVVSILFTLVHPEAISSAYWLTHISLYLFPFLLAVVRETMGSLYGPILLHAGYNLSEYLMYIGLNNN